MTRPKFKRTPSCSRLWRRWRLRYVICLLASIFNRHRTRPPSETEKTCLIDILLLPRARYFLREFHRVRRATAVRRVGIYNISERGFTRNENLNNFSHNTNSTSCTRGLNASPFTRASACIRFGRRVFFFFFYGLLKTAIFVVNQVWCIRYTLSGIMLSDLRSGFRLVRFRIQR